MQSALKLGLFLLCLEIASALECKQCRSYKNNICEHEMETCSAGNDELCMIRKIVDEQHGVNNPKQAESMCMKDCKEDEDLSNYQMVLTFCCSTDFCNDIHLPIMMT